MKPTESNPYSCLVETLAWHGHGALAEEVRRLYVACDAIMDGSESEEQRALLFDMDSVWKSADAVQDAIIALGLDEARQDALAWLEAIVEAAMGLLDAKRDLKSMLVRSGRLALQLPGAPVAALPDIAPEQLLLDVGAVTEEAERG